jgi:hypothetical protein
MEHFKKYLLVYIFLPLIMLMVATSYYRFMVTQDYTVGYEGICDPYTESCYVFCEDDACADPIYYSWIERNAGELYAECGDLVTECDAAYTCPAALTSCTITFCDPATEECEDLTVTDQPAEVGLNQTDV